MTTPPVNPVDVAAPGVTQDVNDAAARVIDETPNPETPPVANDLPGPDPSDAAREGGNIVDQLFSRVDTLQEVVEKVASRVLSGSDGATVEAVAEAIETPLEEVEEVIDNSVPWTHRKLFGKG